MYIYTVYIELKPDLQYLCCGFINQLLLRACKIVIFLDNFLVDLLAELGNLLILTTHYSGELD